MQRHISPPQPKNQQHTHAALIGGTADSIIATQAAPIHVDVKPTANGRKWRASLDGRALCTSAAPLVIAARVLIAKGVNPARVIEMWHANATAWALRGQLGAIAAARLEGELQGQRKARNGPPMRQTARGH